MQSFPGETLAMVDDGWPFIRIDDACFAAKRDTVPK